MQSFSKTTTNSGLKTNSIATDIDNDPFDEFEFKPLTEGLGFHKKDKSTSSNTGSAFSKISHSTETSVTTHNPMQRPLNVNLPSVNSPSKQKTDTQTQSTSLIKPTIHIPNFEDDSITSAQNAVNEILKNLNQKKQIEELNLKKQKKLSWQSSPPSLSAGFLDSMLITAFFLLSLIAMLIITQVDLITNLSQPDPQFLIYWATFSLFAAIHIIYYTIFRAYLGYTPGEWAFDQRCGTELQMSSLSYALKVSFRSLFIMATGFIVVPLISKMVGKDLLADIIGLQIQQQKLGHS